MQRLARYLVAGLQAVHLLLLFCIPVSYATLLQFSESHDPAATILGRAVAIGGVAWAGVVGVAVVVKGEREKAINSLLMIYRYLLNQRWFLILSVGIFMVFQIALLDQLLFYRQVSFKANQDLSLILTDEPDAPAVLGLVQGDSITKFRLRVGLRRLAYRTIDGEYVGALGPIDVPAWWSSRRLDPIIIEEIEPYESLM